METINSRDRVTVVIALRICDLNAKVSQNVLRFRMPGRGLD